MTLKLGLSHLSTMTIHALWVINKAGGLVFSRSYSGEHQPRTMTTFRHCMISVLSQDADPADTLPPLPLNTVLILAGTLHGIHAITSKLTPAPPSSGQVGGLDSFEAEGWGGKVFLTPTGKSLASTTSHTSML
jgi:hypothetical protein